MLIGYQLSVISYCLAQVFSERVLRTSVGLRVKVTCAYHGVSLLADLTSLHRGHVRHFPANVT